MKIKNEFQLLKTTRFCPLFITQFLGALNDNFFKNALIMLLAFNTPIGFFNPNTLINLCAALFILPFFLFSAFAGQLADKFEKSKLITIIKLIEVLLAILAALGFFWNNLILLLMALFLLGTHSCFFGPLKYSILPQHLKDSELVGGNGLIQMGTFIAILLGTILGGLLIAIPHTGIYWVSFGIISVAILGFIASLFIPKARALSRHLTLDWNPLRQTFIIISDMKQQPSILFAVIGISWFWLYGSIFLIQTANYTRLSLSGNEHVATLLLVNFSVGIGLGSALCEWLSNKKIELGFVFLGSFGLTLFALDLALTKTTFSATRIGAIKFLSLGQNWRIMADGFLLGAFGGIYLVPLYTLIQKMSHPDHRSRMIAANNIINAIFMVIASFIAIVFLNSGFSIPSLFIFIATLNAVVGLYLFSRRTSVSIPPQLR